MDHRKEEALEEQIRKLLNMVVIEKSFSPFNAHMVMVPKSDGTMRLTVD